MKLYVWKNPSANQLAQCLELDDAAPAPAAPYAEMAPADYTAWLATQTPITPDPQPTPLLRQDTLTVLNRLTDAESQALHNAQQSDYRVSKFVLMASSSGVIDQADPNYNAAVTLLDSLGIIAAARWPDLLAP